MKDGDNLVARTIDNSLPIANIPFKREKKNICMQRQ